MLLSEVMVGAEQCDLRFEEGRLAARVPSAGGGLEPREGEEVLKGGRVTSTLAEPHVHLDAALLGARKPNVSGTLKEGIANWAELRADLTVEDVRARAVKTAELYLGYGATRLRTHVDTGNLLAVETLLEVREELSGRGIELQVVAFPQQGILTAPGRRASWERAVEMGCDAVGGVPHLERTAEEGWETVRLVFDLAEKHDKLIDLHCDETDDPGCRNLELVCAETLDRGWRDRVVAGHCTALASYPDPYAAKVIDLVAASGVQIVVNPLDNIVLQGRYDGYPKRRGLTRVDELWAGGATVGIGHDSVMDPWYRLGTANLLDAAYMLVHAGHLTQLDQMRRVFSTLSTDNHLPFGGPPALEVAAAGPLLWWEEADEVEILRLRPRPRLLR